MGAGVRRPLHMSLEKYFADLHKSIADEAARQTAGNRYVLPLMTSLSRLKQETAMGYPQNLE